MYNINLKEEAAVLSHCRQGDKVSVKKVNGAGSFRKRLLEMGIIKGADMEIVKYAPLKDPLEMVLNGYHLTLRMNEADKIEISRPHEGE